MPTVTSASWTQMAEHQASTTRSGNLLGRASELTARLVHTTTPAVSPIELMATTTDPYYLYSSTQSPLIDNTYSRLQSIASGQYQYNGIRTASWMELTTTTKTTTTTTTTTSMPYNNLGHEFDVVSSSPLPTPSLYSLDELGHWSTASNYAALIHALLASFSVILVSELGDKTFIITAIMAMKNSRSLVFIASALALFLMTVLSVGMGVAVTVIPEVYTHYASILLFLCFGLKMLKEAYDMTRAGSEAGESEFEEVERSLEGNDDAKPPSPPPGKEVAIDGASEPLDQPVAGIKSGDHAPPSHTWYTKIRQTLYVAPIVIKVFTMVFVAEWGDRSQISTVILAAREDVIGVFVGSLSGHVFCTGLAVIGGRFVADMISVRTMTLLGGIIFLFFAAFEMLMGPEQQV